MGYKFSKLFRLNKTKNIGQHLFLIGLLIAAVTALTVTVVKAATPTVITGSSSSITQDSATLSGNSTDAGGKPITQRGFQYGTDTNYGQTSSESVSSTYSYTTQWGNNPSANGKFAYPRSVATDTAGNIYIADPTTGKVQKFDSNGSYLSTIVSEVNAVTVDDSGNIFLATFSLVKKYDSNGNFIAQWGGSGSGNGQFSNPSGIATDSSGDVYVADSQNNRIQKFDNSGNYLTQWGSAGSGNGQFNSPQGIATDSSGNLFVADMGNNRIQKFDNSGNYLSQWGSFGNGNSQFYSPFAVATDSSGNVFVANTNQSRIQKFTNTGTYLTQWGTNGAGNGQFRNPQGIATDSSGNVYVADTQNKRIQKFDNSGQYLTQWGHIPSSNGQFQYPQGIATDNSSNIYVADTNNNRIQKFDSSGNHLAQWGSTGSGNGQFNGPSDITIDSSGNVYVTDSYNNRIQKFDSTGNYLAQWGSTGSGNGQFNSPQKITTDSSGNVFVTDSQNNRIQKFSNTGTYLTQWGTNGTGDGQFNYPMGIATDSSGNVFVTDSQNNRIQKFDNSGSYLTQWGGYGQANVTGKFYNPSGVATDTYGNVYVADTYNNRIQKFTGTGTYLTKWGTDGFGDNNLRSVSDVAVDTFGNSYTLDLQYERVQKFAPSQNTGAFTKDISTLVCGTTYHYRAFATNADGTSYGGDTTFTTNACPTPPVVSTGIATDIGKNFVGTINYSISSDGGAPVSLSGIEYGLTTSYGSSAVGGPNTVGSSTTSLVGLTCETTYHYRAFATNSVGTTVGDDAIFTTSACPLPPTVNTGAASNISTTTATLNGSAPSTNGGGPITQRGFEYGTTNSYGNTKIENTNLSNPYLTKWGSFGSGDGQLSYPRDITTDSSSNVFVADTLNHRIQKYDSAGNYLAQWGGYGGGSGQFAYPQGITTDSSGNVYVADTNNSRIQKFDSDGNYISQWGGYGGGNGQFSTPQGIATDANGNIYVNDSSYNRIQKFDSDGNYISQWGTGGSGDSQFNVSVGIAVDGSGNVYVADTGNHRIQIFDSAGNYISQWGGYGSSDGQFVYPNSITIDSYGYVYVTDTNNDRIQKFDSSGTYITKWGGSGSNNGQFSLPTGITSDTSGNVYIADNYNHRIQKFAPPNLYEGDFTGGLGNLTCETTYHYRAFATNSEGTTYAADTTFTTDACPLPPTVTTNAATSLTFTDATLNGSVASTNGGGSVTQRGFEYGLTASYGDVTSENTNQQNPYIAQWGGYGSGDGQLNLPYGLTADSNGNVYVVDFYNNRIQKYNDSGTYITQWGSEGSGDGQFYSPYDVTTDATGNVYVSDFYNYRIQKFDSNGNYLTQWGSSGNGDGQFYLPTSLTTDSSGNVYVVDSGNYRIQKFDSNGNYLAQWGDYGSGNGQFYYPYGITTDSSENVYVTDGVNHRIQKFSANGTFLTQWGSNGSGNGQFLYPQGITTDASGNVYVADRGNQRIQKFDDSGTYITQWGSEGSGDGQFYSPYDVTTDATGNVYVADSSNHRIQKFGAVSPYEGDFSRNIDSLNCETTYHYRAFATNSIGTSYGADETFTTDICPTLATVITRSVSNITGSTADAVAQVVSEGNNSLTAVGIEYGLDTNYGDSAIEYNGIIGNNTLTLTNLSCETTYHYRAFATNLGGTVVGDDNTFTTSNCKSDVPTGLAFEIGSTKSINLTWIEPSFTGQGSITSYKIYYRTLGSTDWSSVDVDNTTSYTLDNLAPGTQYEIRVTAINDGNYESDPSASVVGITATPNFQPISDCQQLQNMQNILDANYELVRNIDCSVTNPNNPNFDSITWDASGFNPIGSNWDNPYTGVFKGNNYTITGLYMNKLDPGEGTYGLFGMTNQAIVQDVVLESPSIVVTSDGNSGKESLVSALVGAGFATPITNVRVQNPEVVYFGGEGGFAMVGTVTGGSIDSPINSVRVSNGVITNDSGGDSESGATGGLVGYIVVGESSDENINITGSLNSFVGTLSGSSSFTGGLTGYVYTRDANSYNFNNSYTQAVIVNESTGTQAAGGLIGYIATDSDNTSNPGVTINNSYAAGLLSAPVQPPSIKFNNPTAVAINNLGNVYVTDNNRIQKFDSFGNYLAKWGSGGSGDGELSSAKGIATDNIGNVYVVDSDNNRVQKFDSFGNYLTKWGSGGSGDGQFSSPSGIATDNVGNVYVVDTYNNRIQKFDSNGNYLRQWGSVSCLWSGSPTDGNFCYPYGITTNESGNVYVADSGNHRIQVFDFDGNYLNKWGDNGSGDGQLVGPQGITSDASGNIFVTDYNNNRVQKFDSTGTYLAQWGSYGSGNGQFYSPGGITVDNLGNIYVADIYNYRIQKFDSSGNFINKWGSYNSGDSLTLIGGLIGFSFGSTGTVRMNNAFSAIRLSHGISEDVFAGGLLGVNGSNLDNAAYFVNNFFDADFADTTNCVTDNLEIFGVTNWPISCTPISGNPRYFSNRNNPPMNQWDFDNIWAETPLYPIFSTKVTNSVALTTVPQERITGRTPKPSLQPSSLPLPPQIASAPEEPNIARNPPRYLASNSNPSQNSPNLLDKFKDFIKELPEPVVRAFPYFLMSLVGVGVLFMLLAAKRQATRLGQLRILIAKQRSIAQQRDTFWHLAANYLRAPVTLLIGGSEELKPKAVSAAKRGRITNLVKSIQTKVSDIMHDIESSQVLAEITWPTKKPIHVLRSLGFWIPILALVVLLFIAQYIIIGFRQLDVSAISYITQFVIFGLVSYALYWALGNFWGVKQKVRNAEILISKQSKALSEARSSLVSHTFGSLKDDVAALIPLVNSLSTKSESTNLLNQGSTRLSTILDSFYLLNLAEAGQLSQLSSLTDSTAVTKVIEETSAKQADLLQHKKITLKQDDLNQLSMPGSHVLVKQVLDSVLMNAIEFSKDGGIVTITKIQDAALVGVAITDAGAGIDEEQLPHLFDPFTKADGDDALRMNHEGLGIDLYLDKLIMQHLGGDITATSKQGKGTTIKIWWPAVR